MRVRPFGEDDAGAVRSILDATYGSDPWLRSLHEGSHGPALDGPFFRRTLVAEDGDAVVAAGTIVHGQRHPRRSWLSLDVAPAERRRGIGTALLGELRSLADRPLCARGRYAEEAAIGFLHRHGFGVLDRSWGGRFDPADVVALLRDPSLGRPPTLDEAAAFFERWYQEMHAFDPPTPWPLERAQAFFCGDAMIEGSLAGVREDGRLVGAASLIRTPGFDPGDELYLVWAGTLEADEETATTLVAACVRFALGAGKAVRFEVNEPNVSVRTVLERLGVLGEPELGIFAEDAG